MIMRKPQFVTLDTDVPQEIVRCMVETSHLQKIRFAGEATAK